MNENKTDRKDSVNQYIKYSSLGLQVALIAGAMAFIGVKLDAYMENATPWFTLLFSILGVAGAMIKLIRSVS